MNSASVGANDATQIATPNAMPGHERAPAGRVSTVGATSSAPKSAPTPMAIVIQL